MEDEVLFQDTTNVGPQDINMAKPTEETVIYLECYSSPLTCYSSPEDLPPKFTTSKLTNIKKLEKLISSSYNLFKSICVVEQSFSILAEKNRVFLRDAFEAVLIAVAERSLRERRLGVSVTKKK